MGERVHFRAPLPQGLEGNICLCLLRASSIAPLNPPIASSIAPLNPPIASSVATLVQALPSVHTLRCLTGKIDNKFTQTTTVL